MADDMDTRCSNVRPGAALGEYCARSGNAAQTARRRSGHTTPGTRRVASPYSRGSQVRACAAWAFRVAVSSTMSVRPRKYRRIGISAPRPGRSAARPRAHHRPQVERPDQRQRRVAEDLRELDRVHPPCDLPGREQVPQQVWIDPLRCSGRLPPFRIIWSTPGSSAARSRPVVALTA